MLKSAVILCAGFGTKMWPYAQIRSKVMIPVSNMPIVSFSVNALIERNFENIIIVAGKFSGEISAYFRDYECVSVIEDCAPRGTAFSLLKAREQLQNKDFLVLYGDTIVSRADIDRLIEAFEKSGENAVLAAPILDRKNDHIGMCIENGAIECILGHPRDDITHFFGGFAFKAGFIDAFRFNAERFTYTEVGMMAPTEGYIESTIGDEMARGRTFPIVKAQDKVYDIDKPWQIMEASREINEQRCSALTQNEIGEGTTIDPTASISGFIKTGKNCCIGKNVIISGNIIIGDNTKILNGAIVSKGVVVGNDSSIRNCCYLESGSTVGNECIVSHAAELDGVIFNRVYLYHYMEFYGVIGENTDLGAATVCGTLRFDDTVTVQKIKGRKEYHDYADGVFLGDFCRTGVNAILMPGVKTGVYSVVGAGVVLNKDIKDNTIIYNQQNLVEKSWGGPDIYGW